MKKVLADRGKNPTDEQDEDETEEPLLNDLLALNLHLQPEHITPEEATELETEVKKDFTVLLGESKKSLRRTFTYIGGIIRGYLRRGKSNINWIRIMRSNFLI